MRKLTTWLIVAGAIGVVASADLDAEEVRKARAGTLYCGGNYSADNESRWVLRNYNEFLAIFVERVRFFDASGAVIYDSAVSGLPVSDNALLGPGDNRLDAHESTRYRSEDLVTSGVLMPLPGDQRPIQLVIDWFASGRGVPLDGSLVRRRFAVNGGEIGRHQYDCRFVKR